jgi:nickel-dependent lactate racemase
MKIALPYGKGLIEAEVPDRNIAVSYSSKKEKPVKNTEVEESARALNVERGKSVVIITTDITRACPDRELLPPILKRCHSAKEVKMVVALGLHPAMSRKELSEKLGTAVTERYRVLNHNTEDCIDLGKSSRNNVIEVSREVMDADIKVATGFIEPHFFAGFSGGRKSIMPGVSGRRAIYENHSYRIIDDPKAREGILEGNPVHEDACEHAERAGLDFIVNVTLNRDREITHVFCGDPFEAHKEGCMSVEDVCGMNVKDKVDIALTSNGGAPLDMNLYQTVKGIAHASSFVREGGIIIIASKCDKKDKKSFERLHTSLGGARDVLDFIRKKEPVEDQWENQILARAQLRHRIFLLSDMDKERVRAMGIEPISSIEEGLDKAFEILGSDASIALLPEGPMIYVRA